MRLHMESLKCMRNALYDSNVNFSHRKIFLQRFYFLRIDNKNAKK